MIENQKREVEDILLREAEKIVIDILGTKEWVDTVKKIVSVASILLVCYSMMRNK